MFDTIRFVEMSVWYVANDTYNYIYVPVVCRNVDCQHDWAEKLGSNPTHVICSKWAKICESAGMTL